MVIKPTLTKKDKFEDPLTAVKPAPTPVSPADLKKKGIKDLPIKDQPAPQPARKK